MERKAPASKHFYDRMLERYGVAPQMGVAEAIVRMIDIDDDSVVLLDAQDYPVCRFSLTYCFAKYIVVYNVIDKVLITAIPITEDHLKKPKRERIIKQSGIDKRKNKRKIAEVRQKSEKHKHSHEEDSE